MRVHIYRFFLLRDREKHRAFSKIARARPIPEPHARTKKSVQKRNLGKPAPTARPPREHRSIDIKRHSRENVRASCENVVATVISSTHLHDVSELVRRRREMYEAKDSFVLSSVFFRVSFRVS